MNELHFAYKVRQLLNRGLHELRPETEARLATARKEALACQRQVVNQSVLAHVGSFFQYHLDHLHIKQALAALVLLVGFVFCAFWIADQHVSELGAVDSALLADDLPIGAFTDKGFDTWLKHGSSQ